MEKPPLFTNAGSENTEYSPGMDCADGTESSLLSESTFRAAKQAEATAASSGEEISQLVRENIAAEWPKDAAGFPHRQAARVIIINPANETYLIQGHDYGNDERKWWFTVGGGLTQGEDPRTGAARELREETGFAVDPARFVGPVLFRKSTFYFCFDTRKQDEYFYLLHISAAEQQEIDQQNKRELTALETHVLDDARWFSLSQLHELEAANEQVYPVGFAQMLPEWLQGWDGVLREVVED